MLFESEFGGQNLISAEVLGRALRNTGIQLVLLGACQSASVVPGTAESTDAYSTPGIWHGTAQSLLRVGTPLTIGMQTSMRVDAALAFIRQFSLSLAAGKPIMSKNFNKYRKAFTKKEISIIEGMVGKEMTELGYTIEYPGEEIHVGSVSGKLYRIKGHLKRRRTSKDRMKAEEAEKRAHRLKVIQRIRSRNLK